jgi:GNAT superfamily N-acetyltransferase
VVSQWGTAVDRDHRGHGLGRWMKGTMLDRVLRERPQARRVATTNATTNRWMLAINHELGFRAVSTWTHWQIETAKVRYTSAQSARPLE